MKYKLIKTAALWLILAGMIIYCELAHGSADSNAVLAFNLLYTHWLEPVVEVDINPFSMRNHGRIKQRPDGSWVRIMSPRKRPINYIEFVWISQHWPGTKKETIDPDYIDDPNSIDDPNLADVLKFIEDPNFIAELNNAT